MANGLTFSGTATVTLDTGILRQNLSTTVNMNGVNAVWQSINVSQSVWTALPTASLSDFRYGIFVNDLQVSGSGITIATGSAGGYPLTTLQSDDVFVLPGSGSNYPVLPLYASVTSGSSPAVLQFLLIES